MPRRRRGLIAVGIAGAVGVLATAAAGCRDDAMIGCTLTQQDVLPESPLALLNEARLDRLPSGFALLGADPDRLTLRWGTIDPATGQLTGEHAAAVDTTAPADLWFAAAGGAAPGDTVLAALGRPAANAFDLEIRVAAFPADGTPGAGPGPVVATVPGGAVALPAPEVAMGTSRTGMVAGLAWVDDDCSSVMLSTLTATGEPQGAPLMLEVTAVGPFRCLAFLPGSSGLTLGYYRFTDPTAINTAWFIVEIRDDGSIETTLSLPMQTQTPGCPLMTTTENGYALVWQDGVGTWQGVYDATTNKISTYSAVPASTFGGPDLQPPVVGYAPSGGDFVIVYEKVGSAELWRLDRRGRRRPGTLGFPSLLGDIGALSTVPGGGGLYVTYADYTATDAGVGTSGRRYFLKASCN